jgi:hypothetical protein
MCKDDYFGQPVPHPVFGSQQLALHVATTWGGQNSPSAKRISPPVLVPGITVDHPSWLLRAFSSRKQQLLLVHLTVQAAEVVVAKMPIAAMVMEMMVWECMLARLARQN